MSQFGMQMPGGRSRRSSMPDVYTGLLALATFALLAACIAVFTQAGSVGKDGSAVALQEPGNVRIQSAGR
jgi:hypothetical protein